MTATPVLVVKEMFAIDGVHQQRGDVISDPAIINWVMAAHPEKVVAAAHEVVAGAVEEAPETPAPEQDPLATEDPQGARLLPANTGKTVAPAKAP